ncbi:hypothetical protein BT69DRAFT_1269361 [Atractiella rhizophila]|nr:hypothetical protein BT69DRAFT_1269361 [Atractiella rhizophila]
MRNNSGQQLPVLYDETFRGVSFPRLEILSLANRVCLHGKLLDHSAETDGSFGMCIANGQGNFMSLSLYESIPRKKRPVIDFEDVAAVQTLFGQQQTPRGSAIVPIVLNDETGRSFILKLKFYIMPSLTIPVFLSLGSPFLGGFELGGGTETYTFILNGEEVNVSRTT